MTYERTSNHSYLRNGSLRWLQALLQISRIQERDTAERINATLSIYVDALSLYEDRMSKEAFLDAAKRFIFFTSISELVEFGYAGKEDESLSSIKKSFLGHPILIQ